ncbi:LytTR family transcriptional regulator [Fibrella sp. HMF5335]|uniref:LytTR family transcriptional regulator n=1 Tax=Fibrella rubiginis TaxID=2817060 RepID=A0A939K692_9BACT|nr:LytTR family DNA-binding domain-containing protein [Fibrella rubiginis]MBO0938603.1 LytTR family transcriptional regulator [Fibrella rubiginis]
MSTASTASSARANAEELQNLRLYQREVGQQSFPVANLVFLQSETNYTWLYWQDGKRMLMPRTLKFYEPKLPKQHFFRLHRNCVVNARYIVAIEREQGGIFVVLTTGERLAISRRRWTAVKQFIHQYKLSMAN